MDVWALNDCYSFIDETHRRGARWFEIHTREVWEADGPEHVKFLKNHTGPVYMLEAHGDIPTSIPYPYELIRDTFFPGIDLADPEALKHLMLGSTIDYMIALALAEGYTTIKLYGINMSTASEYTHQLPSVSFWMGMIRGRGHTLVIPDNCPMMQVPLYGATALALLAALIGDGNLDGVVNSGDYTIWADNFGVPDPDFTTGDYNGDGVVNAADYTLWSDNFGSMVMAPESALQALAEPVPLNAVNDFL